MDEATSYQPANLTVDYDAASHPARIAQYQNGGTGTLGWLWDGNDRFVQCAMAGNQCTQLTFSLEGLADYDPQGNQITVYDRNLWGLVVTYHTASGFGSWTESYSSGPKFSPRSGLNICSTGDANDPTSCGTLRYGKLTADGWTIDNDTWQGVRTSDPTVGQWNTPDAYAGEIHDPMSQKPFMWNRNNPYAYADPSGYCVGPLIVWCFEILMAGSVITAEAGAPGASGAMGLGRTLVIGKLADLQAPGAIGQGERTLLGMADRGSPKANWHQNSGMLRAAIREGRPIRDASVNKDGSLANNTGFLRAERELLRSQGWNYDPISRTWKPAPAPSAGSAAATAVMEDSDSMEDDRAKKIVTEREALGFAPAVERIFSFLSNLGFRHTKSEPTLVRFEGNGRYIEVFHGKRSYAVGAQIGLIDDSDAKFSLPEIAYAFGNRYHEFGGHTKESIVAAVEKLAAEILQYRDMLNGRIPIERIQEYRQRLTDYYAGKSTVRPDY